jgi:hypothetical protein
MNEQAAIEAQRFYARHERERQANAEQLLERCAQHLAESFCITNSSALRIAMRVLSEIECIGAEGFIDIDRSSSSMVLMRDSVRRSVHMVSASELLNLVRSRRASIRNPSPSTG